MADFFTLKAKFPAEQVDYLVDWTSRLNTGETITAHSASVVRGTATIANEAMSSPTQQVFFLAGGVAGEDTLVQCQITTNSVPARTHDIVVRVRIATPA